MTIRIGIWIFPALITLACFASAAWQDRDNRPGPYGAGAFISVIIYAAATVVSLIAWLAWALIR